MKKVEQPSEGMFIIESNLIVSSIFSWVLDSSSSIHIYTSMQKLIGSRRLKQGDMILQAGNGAKITAKVVGTYLLRLLSEFRLDLTDCYFVPVASQNLIFMFVLAQDDFEFNFIKNFYFIYL